LHCLGSWDYPSKYFQHIIGNTGKCVATKIKGDFRTDDTIKNSGSIINAFGNFSQFPDIN
jgi:hypothetical protein